MVFPMAICGSRVQWGERSGLINGHSIRQEERNEMLYLTTHSTHFIYGYMVSDIW